MRRASSKAIVRRRLGAGRAAWFWRTLLVLIAAAMVAGLAWLFQGHPLVPRLALAALALAFRHHWRQHADRVKGKLLMRSGLREGHSICHFAREFDCRAVDTWVIRAVYETLQDELAPYHPAFPLSVTDRLVEDLGIDPEDLDLGIAPGVAERSMRTLEHRERNPLYGRVETAGDLVLFFQGQAQAGRPDALLCTPANG